MRSPPPPPPNLRDAEGPLVSDVVAALLLCALALAGRLRARDERREARREAARLRLLEEDRNFRRAFERLAAARPRDGP